ncbi:glycosyltransferase [Roseateles sp. DC23W]|uniref:Glycosyltransferase n=1 Tax=Pelomonas dachongensis TaxID=3299029 RepID=A0ABW7EW05_9BURK
MGSTSSCVRYLRYRRNIKPHAVIVGGDDVSYGRLPDDAKNWREKMLREVGSQLDPARTHFLGKIPYAGYKRVLQVSAAHIYLTYPFVLSWSMLEAMATNCLLIGSDTGPVREVVRDGVNGSLVGMFSPTAVARTAVQALHMQGEVPEQLRRSARQRALEYNTAAGIQAIEKICGTAYCGPAATKRRFQVVRRSCGDVPPAPPLDVRLDDITLDDRYF